jgi:hypothetical protein
MLLLVLQSRRSFYFFAHPSHLFIFQQPSFDSNVFHTYRAAVTQAFVNQAAVTMSSTGSSIEDKKVSDGAEKSANVNLSVDEKPVSPLSETASPPNEPLTDKEKSLLWKIDYHLIPILFALYMFAFLDRVNIGNAKIQGLTTDLKMSGAMYNVASEILFVPYILLEVPSNLIIKRIRPRFWLSGLMFFWGVTTVCQGVVSSYRGLLVCRVFLGVFEAGIFPGTKSVPRQRKDDLLNAEKAARILSPCTTSDSSSRGGWCSFLHPPCWLERSVV